MILKILIQMKILRETKTYKLNKYIKKMKRKNLDSNKEFKYIY